MDTSETYIKMCHKATEIQKQRPIGAGYIEGDWHKPADYHGLELKVSSQAYFEAGKTLAPGSLADTTSPFYKAWQEKYFRPMTHRYPPQVVEPDYDNEGDRMGMPQREDGDIWLPRQDQLQEMISNEGRVAHPPFYFVDDLYHFYFPADCLGPMPHKRAMKEANTMQNYVQSFTSMEQLWLAFVMAQRFQKRWSGEDWV